MKATIISEPSGQILRHSRNSSLERATSRGDRSDRNHCEQEDTHTCHAHKHTHAHVMIADYCNLKLIKL